MKEAFDYLIKTLKDEFQGLQILLNWPAPKQKVYYPYLVVLVARQELDKWTPKFQERDSSENLNYYVTGQWSTTINIHYISKRGEPLDQSNFIEKMSDFF